MPDGRAIDGRARGLRWLLLTADRVAGALPPGVHKALIGRVYRRMSAWDTAAAMTFMNYGYAAPDMAAPDVAAAEGRERHCAALYARVAGAVDLRGRDVLEVGSGRGGGAAYVRRLGARSVVGLDLAERAVAFCAAHHRATGLTFLVGDAEALPFRAAAFDAVVNVESSHCYPDIGRFLGEVGRVLRPGGALLLADLRLAEHVPALRTGLARSGLVVEAEEEITAGVVRALELDAGRRLALLRRHVPRPLRGVVGEFAGVPGGATHALLRAGRLQYWRFVLRRR